MFLFKSALAFLKTSRQPQLLCVLDGAYNYDGLYFFQATEIIITYDLHFLNEQMKIFSEKI